MTEPAMPRFGAEVEVAIAGYCRQVRRALEQAGHSASECEGTVADVEQHLRLQLPPDATLVQVEAVLARMDPPGAYAGDAPPVVAAPEAPPPPPPPRRVVRYAAALLMAVVAAIGVYYLLVDARLAKRYAVPASAPRTATAPGAVAALPASFALPAAAPAHAMSESEVAGEPADRTPLAIAVLPFQGSDNLANREVTLRDLEDGVINALAADPAMRVVERTQLQAALQELRLSADGAVQPDSAVQVGRLIGARVMVLGRMTRIGDMLTVTVRMMNPETGELAVVRAEGDAGAVAELAEALKEKIADRLGADTKGTFARAPDTASRAAEESLARVRAGLAGKTLPRVLVMIPESHLGAYVRDPAAETELVRWLIACGFAVASPEYEGVQPPRPVTESSSDTEIAFHRNAGWRNAEGTMTIASRALRESVTGGLAAEREKLLALADVVILGEGISERGTEREGLVSAKGRVEVKAVDVRTGGVLLAASEYGAGVDVAERIAGKRALQAAGGALAERLIPELVSQWEAP